MKRIAVRSLVIALGLVGGSVSAQEYYEQGGYGYGEEYAEQDQAYYEQQDSGYYGPQDGGQYGNEYADNGQEPAYDVAQVLSVDPIVERSRPVSRRECWNEPTQVYARNGYRQAPQPVTSGAGAAIGAIIGGVIGHNVSERYHRGPATAAGAVIGGVIGNGIERRNSYGYRNGYANQRSGYPSQQSVQRCREVVEQGGEDQVVGYRVAYAYGGRQYETITDYHPGNEIRVRVQVTPET